MRIGFDGTPLLGERTGIGWVTHDLLTGLADVAPNDDIIVWPISWRSAKEIDPPKRPNIRVVQRLSPARPLRRLWHTVNTPPIDWFIDCDVFHGTNFVVPPSTKTPTVVTVHDLSFVHSPDFVDPVSAQLKWLLPDVVRNAAAVVCDSYFVQQELDDWLPEARGKSRTIYVAPHERKTPLTASSPASAGANAVAPGTPYVLVLGTLSIRKNIPRLLDAFARARQELPDLKLVLAGPPSKAVDLNAHLARVGLTRHDVVITGYIDDLWAQHLLANATMLAFVSQYEGFGMPLLEAMALGVPVLASTAGSLPEIGADAAIYADPLDVDDIAHKLIMVANDETLRAQLSTKGRQRAAEFSWHKSALEHRALYQTLA
jgi:glycosyltransferase involved in cell wall biosynthesis